MTREARAFLTARTDPVRMVIFDCDGVLIDSEALCDRVTAASMTELGWPISPEECHLRFLGWTFNDMVPVVEAQIGRPIDIARVHGLVARLSVVFAAEVEPIPGALDAASRRRTCSWKPRRQRESRPPIAWSSRTRSPALGPRKQPGWRASATARTMMEPLCAQSGRCRSVRCTPSPPCCGPWHDHQAARWPLDHDRLRLNPFPCPIMV